MNEDKKRIEELESVIHNLERDLIHDPLTGLKTRAFFEDEMGVYLNMIEKNNNGTRKEWFGFKNISFIFFDIDHFKKVNDTHGHDVGDMVLKKVSETIQNNLRTGDTLSRWGGEEMVASLLGASEVDATSKAEEIRKKIEELTFPEVSGLSITMSSGVVASEKGVELDELVKRADKALYKAKETGRNKVVAFSKIEN